MCQILNAMDALVTYSSSESDNECEDNLSHGAGVQEVCSDVDRMKRKEDLTVSSQFINQTDNLQPCEESRVTSAADEVYSVKEQTEDYLARCSVRPAVDPPAVAEQLNVRTAENPVGKESFKLAEQENDPVDGLPVMSAGEDFFNLAGAAEPIADELPDSQILCNSKHQSVVQNMCTVSFWNTDVTADDWTHPEKIWGVTYDLSESEFGHVNNKTVNSTLDRDVNKVKGYSSKRHRSVISSESQVSMESAVSVKKSCFVVHHKLAPHLHTVTRNTNRIPRKILHVLPGHSGTVNRIHWNIAEYSHLLLTASMDATVRVWNVLSSRDSDPCVRTLKVHSKAVKAARWSACGRQILSCSYDKFAKLTDVECGRELCSFPHPDHISCVKFNPVDYNLFVSGLTNLMLCWDKRCPSKPVQRYVYKDKFGQVQDLCFFDSGSQFLSCNDIVGRDSPDRTIMIWDFSAGALLSNQIYQEMYTCTRLCFHTTEPKFFAQTNGDYIAEFSGLPPYRINKCKRFEGHKVAGYSVGCDVAPDGQFVVSGSSDSRMVVYDYQRARMVRSLPVSDIDDIVLDVAWHPVLFSTVAAGTWNGHVVVWQ